MAANGKIFTIKDALVVVSAASADGSDAITISNFNKVWQIVIALKSQDDSMMDCIDNLRVDYGSTGKIRSGNNQLNKFIMTLINKVYPDYLWFESFGYKDVWLFQLKYKYLVFVIATIIAWVFFQLNASFATKNSKKISTDQEISFNTPFPFLNQLLNRLKQNFEQSQTAKSLSDALFVGLTRVIAVVLSLLFGLSAKSWWEDIFLYINQVPYGLTDSLFNKDISFYFFTLPMIQHVKGWLLALVFFALIFSGWIYFSRS